MFYPSARDVYFDNVKGKLILLVVLGHLFEFQLSDTFFRFLYVFLYSFVMPTFIFVSGLFFKPKIKGFVRFIFIYLLSQLVFLLSYYCLGKSFSFYSFLTPVWTLWYLLCLVFWYGISLLFERLGYSKYDILVFSIVLTLLSGFINISYFLSLQRACAYFVFFALGMSVNKKWLKKCMQAFSVQIIVVFFILGLIVLSSIYQASFLPKIFYNSYPYSYFSSYSEWLMFGVRLLQFMLSFVFGLFIFKFTSNNKGFYTFCGYYSLWIYLLHSFVLLHLR